MPEGMPAKRQAGRWPGEAIGEPVPDQFGGRVQGAGFLAEHPRVEAATTNRVCSEAGP